MSLLPSDAKAREEYPLATGCFDYFPDALAAVAYLSWKATQQHHPGEDMHWQRDKSTAHADKILRHLAERGKLDTDGIRHSAKVAWRALALLQEELEKELGLPPSRASRGPRTWDARPAQAATGGPLTLDQLCGELVEASRDRRSDAQKAFDYVAWVNRQDANAPRHARENLFVAALSYLQQGGEL